MPHTVEGTKSFRLRIVAAQFIGQAATIFRAPAGLTSTFADVTNEDDHCKFMNIPCITCLIMGEERLVKRVAMEALSLKGKRKWWENLE